MIDKYNGNPWREPSWYPENPYRAKRYEAFDKNLDGFGYRFAEIETYWDNGRDAMLATLKPLLDETCVLLGDRMLKGEANEKESSLCGRLSKILVEEATHLKGGEG